MTTTTDLTQFGARERKILADILNAWDRQGLPQDFYDDAVVPMFNTSSGFVFLTNSDYQACLLNDHGRLEVWHSCPQCGHEGFKADMYHNPSDPDCQEYLADIDVVAKRTLGKLAKQIEEERTNG